MFVAIVLFVLSIIDFSALIITLWLLIVNHSPSSIGTFMLFLIVFLITSVVFYEYTKKFPKNNRNQFVDFKPEQYMKKCDEKDKYYIEFTKETDCWICRNDTCEVALNLSGYLFQKQFICAFVTRSLRYPLINEKKPLLHLFRFRYKIATCSVLSLVFTENNQKKCINIVKNKISQYGILSRAISISRFYAYFLYNRAYVELKQISMINERIYQSQR